jgi:hypothetical protein
LTLGRDYSDHLVRLAVEVNRRPDDLRVGAKPSLPNSPTQHRDVTPAALVFLRNEPPTQQRRSRQHFEEPGGHHRSPNAFRTVSAGQVEAPIREESHVSKDLGLVSPPQVVGISDRALLDVLGRVGQDRDHEFIGSMVGKRPKQHTVHYTEDRGVGADAQGQRKNGDRGVARVSQESAKRLAEVLK